MSHIKGKDTSLEIKVRQFLFRLGYRFRKNVKNLPGKPDVLLRKYNCVLFVNGCFWHHHSNCKIATVPKTNTDFWEKKFARNVYNDKKHVRQLRKMGYHVITLWECKLEKDFNKEMKRVINLLDSYIGQNKPI